MNQYILILFERLYIFSSLIKGAIAPILKKPFLIEGVLGSKNLFSES